MEKAARRSYRGVSFEDRLLDRRERLIDAGIAIYARKGTERASVAAICREAKLTGRHFYEIFGDRDAFFAEAFRSVTDSLLELVKAAIDPASPVVSALVGFFNALLDHPDEARVFLLELHNNDPLVLAIGKDFSARLTELIAPEVTQELMKVGAEGAIMQIARRWVSGGYTESVGDVANMAARFSFVGQDRRPTSRHPVKAM